MCLKNTHNRRTNHSCLLVLVMLKKMDSLMTDHRPPLYTLLKGWPWEERGMTQLLMLAPARVMALSSYICVFPFLSPIHTQLLSAAACLLLWKMMLLLLLVDSRFYKLSSCEKWPSTTFPRWLFNDCRWHARKRWEVDVKRRIWNPKCVDILNISVCG